MNGYQEALMSEDARPVNHITSTGPKKITQPILKKILKYDPESGFFTWAKTFNNNGARKGDVAGYINTVGYVVIGFKKKYYYAHRLAWLYVYGYFPENHIDHIDRNPQNNKISNLREVSQSCNTQNSKIRKNNISGVKGVSFYKRDAVWVAFITINKKYNYLGRFKTKIEAANARYEAEIKNNICFYGETSAYKFIKSNNMKGLRHNDQSQILRIQNGCRRH